MTRQEIQKRIEELGSKQQFIIAEMTRLGFWTQHGEPIPAELVAQDAALQKELSQLLDRQRRFQSRDAMLKEMRQARMAAAKQRRIETKQRREAARKARADAWQATLATDVPYLGEGTPAALANHTADPDRLRQVGLPQFESPLALARAMGLSLSELRFLAYNRAVSTVSHYKRFHLIKKSGGKRLISAPMPRLKKAQLWVLENILSKVQPTEQAHGFRAERSILTNAQPHVGKDVVINIDLKNFFPTVSYGRVKGLLAKLGYSEALATVLALLCTEPDTQALQVDGKTYYVGNGSRYLPQGAPTSPALTNLLAYRLDRRLNGLAQAFGYVYTRYADDLTFSASGSGAGKANQLIWAVEQIVQGEGFVVHPDKISVRRKGQQQRVTGIVVNQKASIDRATLRRFRALLHQIGQTGWEGKTWGNPAPEADIQQVVLGYAHFVQMVKPELGRSLVASIRALIQSRPDAALAQPVEPVPATVSSTATNSAPVARPVKEWWDVL
ncbi:RNA-directed DNA polymerase [Fibrella aestuarina BUZ 2]|uniref:RNA-directed DNA polymerase n=1 Tax=Fibrella aestuarina BUZ 2 TaxID=1166018 RepID=I0KBN6_9BACT|nr:reverse transcriptase family protein [Fibrella aestuarina]CCH01539.1 RNA-directed DNA polymerase [Fibrella aestuarina BUZ 2]